MRRALVAAALILMCSGAYASDEWIPGQHYSVLPTPKPPTVARDTVEVIEVFSYTCGACYRLDHFVAKWAKEKPPYIHFTRLPVVGGDKSRRFARLFYTLQLLHRDDLHGAVFEALRKDSSMLSAGREAEAYEKLQKFAETHGISPTDFRSAYDSPTVLSQLERARALLTDFRIERTPTLVINGKYTTTLDQAQIKAPNQAGATDYQSILVITTALAARERSAAMSAARVPSPRG